MQNYNENEEINKFSLNCIGFTIADINNLCLMINSINSDNSLHNPNVKKLSSM